MYVLKRPDGMLIPETLGSTKSECWYKSFDHVAFYEGEKWRSKFWKRLNPSKLSATKLGYQIVKVSLVEE